MECDKVKGFLSEYIDGVLDAQVKKLIDEHLPACKSCSEELASLNACIKELGVLKGVEAPGNFLEKVHERIERKAGFSKIIQTLFIPVRIKVPLEIAAVAAMVILTINLMESERKTTYMPAKPKIEEMGKIAAEGPGVAELERE
ncbi:MAG: zf-HC2 domain-containing protein, partial [Candidatus Omnitrophica bacterium]|nr:zf-HC2 domain-containing protein [Candidatus Omnitrophota bacterium]